MAYAPTSSTPARCLLGVAIRQLPSYSLLSSIHQTIFRRSLVDQQRPTIPDVLQPKDKLAQFTRDEQIETSMVQIKTDDGKIQEPQPLRRLLQTIDRQTQCIVQLSKFGTRDAAVVQVKSKMDLVKQIRDKEHQVRQQELAQRDKKPKQIELNWAISENDLNLKLRQLESFLDKGKVVEILLAAKKRQRKATGEEGNNVLRKIRQSLQQTGAKEIKPMQGQVLRQASLTVKK